MNKEAFINRVKNNWFLGLKKGEKKDRSLEEIIGWAISEDEEIHLDYLKEKDRKKLRESDADRHTYEKHLVVTDKRVISFISDYYGVSYNTCFLLESIEDIIQRFSFTHSDRRATEFSFDFPVKIVLNGNAEPLELEPRSINEDDRKELKRFVSKLRDLRFGCR